MLEHLSYAQTIHAGEVWGSGTIPGGCELERGGVILCGGQSSRQLQGVSRSEAVDTEESLGRSPYLLGRLNFLPRPAQRVETLEGRDDVTHRHRLAKRIAALKATR